MRRALPIMVIGLGMLFGSCGQGVQPDELQSAMMQGRFFLGDFPVQDRYMVVLNDDLAHRTNLSVEARSQNLAMQYGAQLRRTFKSALRGFAVEMSQADALALSRDERVAFVSQVNMFSLVETQNDATWGLDRLDQRSGLDGKYTYHVDGSGVTAYIIDTGVDPNHRDFGGRAVAGFSSVDDNNGAIDCHGHGTHVAGTIGSATWGVAKNANLVGVRVLGCNGSGDTEQVVAGVDWVVQDASGPAVANMSLGGGADEALDLAVQNAISAGVVFAIASGNENQDACNVSPSRVPEAITVSATGRNDWKAMYSNWGSCVDIFAPGSQITSTWKGGGTSTISGTSMACPHVAGAVALVLDVYPNMNAAEVNQLLVDNATSGKIRNPRGSPNLILYTAFLEGGGPDPCEGETPVGRCDGDTLIWCESGQVMDRDCAAEDLTCGFDDADQRFDCIDESSDPCDGETYEGRCEGNTVIRCVDGEIIEETCGWFRQCKLNENVGYHQCRWWWQ